MGAPHRPSRRHREVLTPGLSCLHLCPSLAPRPGGGDAHGVPREEAAYPARVLEGVLLMFQLALQLQLVGEGYHGGAHHVWAASPEVLGRPAKPKKREQV